MKKTFYIEMSVHKNWLTVRRALEKWVVLVEKEVAYVGTYYNGYPKIR